LKGITVNFLRALVLYYVHEFQRLLLLLAAIVIATIIGGITSKLIIWILGLHPGTIDSLLPICILLVLVGEAFTYQRYLRWRFFKDLTE
jgi:hypothetical protein